MINLFLCCGNVSKRTFFQIFIGIDFIKCFIELFYLFSVLDIRNDNSDKIFNLVWKICLYSILYLALMNFILQKKINGIFQKIYSWVTFISCILSLILYLIEFFVNFQFKYLIFKIYLPIFFYYSYYLMFSTDCIKNNIFDYNRNNDREEEYNNIENPIIIAD